MALYALLAKIVEFYKKDLGLVSFRMHSFLGKLINPDSLVVDLGANLGDFSSELSNLFGCKSYAVEASPDLCSRIKETYLINKSNYAISSSNKPLTFYLSQDPEANSIYKSSASSFGDKGVMSVSGITLETFLKNNEIKSVDLLKVDIEGAEVDLFKSTSNDTLSKIKQITIEFHDFIKGSISSEEVKIIEKKLNKLGFFCLPLSYMFDVYDNADILFINKKQCKLSNRDWLSLHILNLILRIEKTKKVFKRSFLRSQPA